MHKLSILMLFNVPDHLDDRIRQHGYIIVSNAVDGFGIHIKIVVADNIA